jgi:hypothetical protein
VIQKEDGAVLRQIEGRHDLRRRDVSLAGDLNMLWSEGRLCQQKQRGENLGAQDSELNNRP